MPIELTIEKLIYGGDGLARIAAGDRAKSAFVPFTLPGERIALSPDGTEVLGAAGGEVNSCGEATILVGAERAGLPQAMLARCDRSARIPIASHSLNAAMAATIALYELSRASLQGHQSSRVRAR